MVAFESLHLILCISEGAGASGVDMVQSVSKIVASYSPILALLQAARLNIPVIRRAFTLVKLADQGRQLLTLQAVVGTCLVRSSLDCRVE